MVFVSLSEFNECSSVIDCTLIVQKFEFLVVVTRYGTS